MKTFYSNGKLLITGEYVVLDGALALALPTKFGQTLNVENGNDYVIKWTSFDDDKSIWFEDIISFEVVKKRQKTDDTQSIRNKLIDILHEAYKSNPNFIENANGYIITTELSFPKNWGLGTSSTLINNIAQWVGIDAFELLQNSFGGSGYDIACAQHCSAILYQLDNNVPIVKPIDFNPDFAQSIYFVYLNKKQNSREAIAGYYNKQADIYKVIPDFNAITNVVSRIDNVNIFANELTKHEILLSEILELSTIKETVFDDFNGVVKSLGAWGGDFVMVVSRENPTEYFKSKGFKTVIPYYEMIL